MSAHSAASPLYRKHELWALVCITFSVDFFTVARLPLLEQLVCHTYLSGHGDSTALAIPEHLCKSPAVQSQVARLNGSYFYFNALSTILLSLPYTWVAARLGKKPVLVMGVVATAIQYLLFYSFCTNYRRKSSSEDAWPDKLVWFCIISDIFGGGTSMAYTLLWSSITEATAPERRSSTMFKTSSLLLMTDFIAVGLASLLLSTINSELCVVAAAAYLLNIPIWLLPRPSRPSRPRHSMNSSATITTTTLSRPLLDLATVDAPEYIASIVQSVDEPVVTEGEEADEEDDSLESGGSSSSEIQRAVLVSRRWYDIKNQLSGTLHEWILQPVYPLSFAVMFLFTFASSSDMILQQWTSRAFDWSLLQTTHLLTFNMFIGFVAFSLLPLLTRRLRGMFTQPQKVDYYLTMISLTIRLCGALFMSASSKSYTFVPALVLYSLGVGFVDSFRAFLSTWISDQRITEMFSVLTIVSYSSMILGGVVWPWLFTVSADSGWGGGLPYLVSSACFSCAMVILVGVWQLLKV